MKLILALTLLVAVTATEWTGNVVLEGDELHLPDEATFYAASRTIPLVSGSTFHVEYSVFTPAGLTCGGSYIKVGHREDDAFDKETPYDIMFGSDAQCNGKHTLHALMYSSVLPDVNHPMKERLDAPKPDDTWHTYRLSVRDTTFDLFVDGENVRNGTIDEHVGVLLPREIEDPDDEKPDDWEETPMIPDPEAKKPDDWPDDEEEYVEDVDAEMPEDWNEEDDGEWEPELIKNPLYKGEWRPPLVNNPKYIGPWKPRKIPNPSFVDEPYRVHRGLNYVAIDVWTMTGGIKYKEIKVWEEKDEL